MYFILLIISLFTGWMAAGCKQAAPAAPQPAVSLWDTLLTDGFDFPVGDKNGTGVYTDLVTGRSHEGWYIATRTAEVYALGIHTGEDWNGKGGGNTDLGQPVYAIGKGKVLAAQHYGAPWGNVILVEHRYVDNGQVNTVFSLYAHLQQIKVKPGDMVTRRQQIGTIGTGDGAYPAHLHLEIRSAAMAGYAVTYWPSSEGKNQQWVKKHYLDATPFIKAHRHTEIPASLPLLVVANKSDYRIYLYCKGVLDTSYPIALSQVPDGPKLQQGDNRMPEGAYRIIQKSRGPFSGAYSEYFGLAWMRINYPNSADAERAKAKGTITAGDYDRIVKAHRDGAEPPKNTALGGGIGIHGWAGEWPSTNRHLTWGCISIQNSQLVAFYNQVPLNTPIYILP